MYTIFNSFLFKLWKERTDEKEKKQPTKIVKTTLQEYLHMFKFVGLVQNFVFKMIQSDSQLSFRWGCGSASEFVCDMKNGDFCIYKSSFSGYNYSIY